ncbi:MAG TPA: cytochrome c oxidase subunit 3 [Methylomirabilota bacterium]|nr:cytochrome c oxidase subunit 3 [Methylomirabilota bacterium]
MTDHAAPLAAHDPNMGITGIDHRKMGMWAFLGSDCMFFGSLIGTYLSYKGKSLGGPTPHEMFNIPLTSVSAFVLLMSSVWMVLALNYLRLNNMRWAKFWLLMTALFGAWFVGNQVYEFNEFAHEGLTLQTSLFGSSFFTLTGFHGAHVTGGVIWLLSLVVLAQMGKLDRQDYLKVEIAGLYWHFVDIVWIAIFTLVYLIP